MDKRLSWFGQVQRRDEDNIAKSVLNTRIDGTCPHRNTQAEVDRPIERRKEEKQYKPRAKKKFIVLHLYHILASLTDDVCADAL